MKTPIFARAISTYLTDADGRPRYINGILFDITEGKIAEEQLHFKTQSCEEANAALKVLLEQREADKTELEEKVIANLKSTIVPFLDKLKSTSLNDRQKVYIDIVESNLKEITSHFSHRLSSAYANLMPAEMQIANLIKQGKTTKEIAGLLNLSCRTFNFHRENIHSKLNLKNKKVNLRTHLLSLE
jgi:DNA-binding CsgD family transcriptional regulator